MKHIVTLYGKPGLVADMRGHEMWVSTPEAAKLGLPEKRFNGIIVEPSSGQFHPVRCALVIKEGYSDEFEVEGVIDADLAMAIWKGKRLKFTAVGQNGHREPLAHFGSKSCPTEYELCFTFEFADHG
ncbi:MAG: hypothetical protein KGI45_04335 [Patescibacteria group bacterium]|nr:hypothetical protein [Patescibacteria group bacterium]MDE1967261.1 hypothetical protein [Patescibacteria group bacterium]